MKANVKELVDAYRSTAVAWDALQGDAAKANPLFDRLQQIYKQLRTDNAGRDGISALMDDPNVGVRVMAATHALPWAPAKASKVLESIQSEPGLHAVSAKSTLKSFREGRLNLDW